MRLLSFGHGTLAASEMAGLLGQAGVSQVVDVRSVPRSRRHPHVWSEALADWLPGSGIGYRWEPELGGWRRPSPDSPNVSLRHPSFRGYADYMATDRFAAALDRLLEEVARTLVAAMCSETLWWRCHRRLIADAVVLTGRAEGFHLGHDGRLSPHRVTEGARLTSGTVVYDGLDGPSPPLPGL